jgi:hypothetical protein
MDEAFVPRSYDDWRAYVGSLSGEELFEVAEGAADMRFAQKLLDEGYPSPAVHAILVLFADRFTDLGQDPPSWIPGMLIDYRDPHRVP